MITSYKTHTDTGEVREKKKEEKGGYGGREGEGKGVEEGNGRGRRKRLTDTYRVNVFR